MSFYWVLLLNKKLRSFEEYHFPWFWDSDKSAATLPKSDHKLKVEQHCASRSSMNQTVFLPPLTSLLHPCDTLFLWSHRMQLPWSGAGRFFSKTPLSQAEKMQATHWSTVSDNSEKKQQGNNLFTLRTVRHRNRCPERPPSLSPPEFWKSRPWPTWSNRICFKGARCHTAVSSNQNCSRSNECVS